MTYTKLKLIADKNRTLKYENCPVLNLISLNFSQLKIRQIFNAGSNSIFYFWFTDLMLMSGKFGKPKKQIYFCVMYSRHW